MLGIVKVHVVRGMNLAYRDTMGSDPYVVLRMGSQKVKTSVKKNNVNPEWNEELTLCVTHPNEPIKIELYDKDTFTPDDEMGIAELDVHPLLEAFKMCSASIADGTTIKIVNPSDQNCLVDESHIKWIDGKLVQNVILRLKNVECGEVELQLTWIRNPVGPSY